MLREYLLPEAYFAFVCLIIAYVRLFVNGQNLGSNQSRGTP